MKVVNNSLTQLSSVSMFLCYCDRIYIIKVRNSITNKGKANALEM